jgi:uroporphyrin-III C-methyltransferase
VTVYLVGAGPGDPELLSVRGARLLGSADVVLHDRLARPLLALAPDHAEVIDVGKSPGAAPVPQEEINRLLVEHGRGRCVVRLKGGDPFVFARGAEEAMALKAAGIAFEIVPGISSVVAAPAAAGVPLTWRGVSRGFTVLTGHENPDRWAPGYAEALVSFAGTIVVVMATAHITQIAARLVEAGLDPQTPTAAVKSATTSAQVVRRATLATIESALLDPPSLFVIGDVAGLDLRPAPPGA